MKFLIVDDHALVREGLRHVLESLDDHVTVLETENAIEAYALVEQHADIDLVLLDLRLPGVHGYTAMQELHQRHITLPVVILSSTDDTQGVVAALKMGAVGFIPKSSPRDVMLQALRLVLSGGVYIPPQALGLAGPGGPRESSNPDPKSIGKPVLTDRQAEVLALIAQGKPNKIIAGELNISEATVKAHVTDIMRALKVTNRAQAAVAARRLGIC
ncbi:MAG TPA: response regulator transcription factor [Burkholderiales bacterium]|nr:response regulator transcription factor [Burkholderiales bacterium]